MSGFIQILIFLFIILAVTKPLGTYMFNVMEGRRTLLTPILRPVELLWYRLCGVREDEDQSWLKYAGAMVVLSAVSVLATYLMLRLQGLAPAFLNPQKFGGDQMPPHLAFNTAVSFASNTNWQSYAPEAAVNYASNMIALAIHNWLSAAVGMAVAVALVRGFVRHSANAIGNFWVDVTRSTLYVLLPISIIAGLVMICQGVPQTFAAPIVAHTLEGAKQTIALGPVASQEVIKMLGTNGGGFFNANSAHPFENPNNLTNLLQLVLIFAIPAGLTYTFGRMVGNTRQGWAIFAAMACLFLVGAVVTNAAESGGTTALSQNMEGKEARFGIGASTLFATVTTDASCGAVNAMHDSFTPLGGLVPLANILTGEVIFGGVGAGLYGVLMFAVIAVFIAGLMVGRTPEYLGKKIGRFEVQMAMLATLVLAADVLLFTALSANTNYPKGDSVSVAPKEAASMPALASWNALSGTAYGSTTDTYYGSTRNNLNNSGPHGFSEVLYSYASAAGNNGSAFAGITANTPHYNWTLGIAMLIGRWLMIIPLLAMAGSLARKKPSPVTAGTFPTDTATFAMLLAGSIILINALTFFPAMSLGPIVEHFQMRNGVTR